MKEADLMILRFLRQNARENLTQISKKTKIPVSTLFDRIKNLEQGVIRKYASLLDFKKIGFPIRLTLLLKCDPSIREELKRYLLVSEQVNSLMRINNGYEYLAECVFKDLDAHQRFLDQLLPFRLNFQEHFVLEDLKRETFLSEETNLAVLMR